MKRISAALKGAALVLSHAMCAVVAWEYGSLMWGERYAGYSAPAYTAFLVGIPFAAAIAVCLTLARFFCRNASAGRK